MDNPAHLQHPETPTTTVGQWLIEYIAETDSTQTDLLARTDAGLLYRPTALRTDYQRMGRGRLDRRWDAPPGSNLLVSLGVIDVPPDPGALMRRAGVAVVDAVHGLGVADVGLKWPNDVLIDGRKAAGLLAQRTDAGPVVVGIGLNVGWAPAGAASIASALGGANVPESSVLPTPASVLVRVLQAWDDLSDETVLAHRYRASLRTLGQEVRVEVGGDTIVGRAIDLESRGQLVIEVENGSLQVIDIGDVHHLRPL